MVQFESMKDHISSPYHLPTLAHMLFHLIKGYSRSLGDFDGLIYDHQKLQLKYPHPAALVYFVYFFCNV